MQFSPGFDLLLVGPLFKEACYISIEKYCLFINILKQAYCCGSPPNETYDLKHELINTLKVFDEITQPLIFSFFLGSILNFYNSASTVFFF